MKKLPKWIVAGLLILLLGAATPAQADEKIVRLYLDADRSGTKQSGLSIEQGIRVALSEIGNQIDGYRVEIVIKDHHGNSRRSKRHLDQFLDDPKGLAVFGGLHSPPLLAYRDFINKSRIPVLVPWAAAAPITRYPSAENWIFRLSIDDSKAGYVIAGYAVQKHGLKKPYLLLENTGWGKSNHKTMSRALTDMGIGNPPVSWFNWGLSEAGARDLLRTIARSGADVILFVGNAPEGKVIAKVMSGLPTAQRLPIASHWGITGGDFPEIVNAKMRTSIYLNFIQTSFSFISNPDHKLGQQVLASAKALWPQKIKTAKDIKAPAGFIHAYDLTRLMIAAVKQVGLTGDILIDRQNLRSALENLDTPVEGLIKTYQKPFGIFDQKHPDAHEALGIEDFVMAHYGEANEIIIEPWKLK